jgi:UDP-N-acetylmuramyl tripeptide synthase
MPRQTSLGDLLEDAALAGTIQVVAGDAVGGRITGITEDSRLVGDGAMFVARPGTMHDGGDHVADAIERGAGAILAVPAVATGVPAPVVGIATPDPAKIGGDLAFRFHGHPERRMGYAGITGTNGKTTVATLAHHAGPNHARRPARGFRGGRVRAGRDGGLQPRARPGPGRGHRL